MRKATAGEIGIRVQRIFSHRTKNPICIFFPLLAIRSSLRLFYFLFLELWVAFPTKMSGQGGSWAKNKNHSPLLCEPAGSAAVPIRVVDKKK
ncbi:MAG: hypothetical protein GY816_07880 [Cytophagales bacterium]|nr:hypothetical protein [Cytophagales bacterium]